MSWSPRPAAAPTRPSVARRSLPRTTARRHPDRHLSPHGWHAPRRLRRRQIRLAAEQKGERIACLEARKHYAWYLKGIPYAGYYKEKISQVETLEQVEEITKGIKRDLRDPEE